MKLNRTSGAPAIGGAQPSADPASLKATHASEGSPVRSGAALPAPSQFIQARPDRSSAGATAMLATGQRTELAPGLARLGRTAARAEELADRLASAPAEIKGAELARLHGPGALARVQRCLTPLVDRLATAHRPTAAALVPSVARGALPLASASALRTAATLAAESLRLEDHLAEPFSPSSLERALFRLDLAVLGRDIEGIRGLTEILPSAQQAIAGLLFH